MSTTTLTGETKIYPVIGDPIAQVRSPRYLTDIMAARSLNSIVPPAHVAPEAVPQFMAAASIIQNLGGVVVTLPHKTAAIAYCDRTTERAAFIGAVNVIRKLSNGEMVGDNLDGEAYITGIRNCGGTIQGKRVLQLGVGGAGSAVAYQFAAENCAELHLFDLDKTRLDALVEKMNERFPGRIFVAQSNSPEGMDIVANVTPVGMRDTDPTPVPAERLCASMFYADAITKPAITRLGEAAKALGCATMQGEHMFDAQADKLVDFLTQDEAQFLTQFESQC